MLMNKNAQIQDNGSAIMDRLATRVRAARAALGLSRRALSERSGVSPRYLAQIEAGEGNISVILLDRVATALDVRIEDLVSETDPMDADSARVAQLYQAAKNPAILRAQRICLVGLRGAGKSTLGAQAAEKLKIPFVELNDLIEAQSGMPTAEVMALYGQDGYRAAEAQALNEIVASHNKLILAVSGGIVAAPATYAQVLERFHTIWIRTSPAEHMARVRAQGDLRPMEGNPGAMDQLKALLTTRTPDYQRAFAQVDTTSRPVQSSVNDVLTVIAKHRLLTGLGPV
ncbi:helix-turn-helix transcriptional regulator [uncultured Tateyamaria sp.]|uniref:helix-turn-helix transcriptional regulator n=2 Tax=Tateyamaria TaxID=299261 RepID=UPI00260320A3|nr:helix-turn-helix transcriptional regulator [uncultured Tateyamaria sp.]